MKYGSVCSGIEAATAAWHPMGWEASFFSEIEKFPRQVLAHHYPDVPLHGDFTTIQDKDYDPIELLVGGTPCQAFSIAGLRKGFADERGNLTLEFVRLAQRLRPQWLLWENVPGVLSQDGGRAFGSFLGGLAECGYGFAYRVLDAQYFGVPQRRRRVFVVGYSGDWRPPAAVLFERESLCGDITPSREEGQIVAPTIRAGATNGSAGHGARSGDSKDELIAPVDTAKCLTARGAGAGNLDPETANFVIPIHDKATRCNGGGNDRNNDGSANGLGIGKNGDPMPTLDTGCNHAVAFQSYASSTQSLNPSQISPTLDVGKAGGTAVAFDLAQITSKTNRSSVKEGAPCPTLNASGLMHAALKMQVRRLTPRECERLQGFPDDYTRVTDKTSDGPRYKAIGNSMAVPVMRWLGQRINDVDELMGA